MKKWGRLSILSGAIVVATCASGADWTALNEASRKDALSVIRPGEPGKAPFWNAHSKAFMHPPAFDFVKVHGATKYRFVVTEIASGKRHEFFADTPWASLAPVWDAVKPGYVLVVAEGIGVRDYPFGVAGTRYCYRAAPFKGPYPSSSGDYAAAAQRCFEAVYRMPHVQGWLKQDTPPEGYDLYCYPSKILASIIKVLVRYSSAATAEDAGNAILIARKMADWLIAQRQPEGTPLEYLPPTYWGDRRGTAIEYRGQNMLIYPIFAGQALFRLYKATGDTKYREAALRIAATMRKIQNAEGTWWLKVFEKDGSPVRKNLLVPGVEFFDFFEAVAKETGDAGYQAVADRALSFVEKGPFRTWNWDGQFEDIDPKPPYVDLTATRALGFARLLFRKGRIADARLTLSWCEDQFAVWSDPIHHMDWKNWKMPTGLEQYDYYTPIDATMANFVRSFSAAWKATGDELYLEKARAMADCLVRNQRADGTIPTYFDNRGGTDWVNCMASSAESLATFAEAIGSAPSTARPKSAGAKKEEYFQTPPTDLSFSWAPPLSFAKTIEKPISVTTNAAGNVLLDFGEAAFGWLEFVDSPQGEYDLSLGEIVRDGAVWFAPSNSCIRNVRLSGMTVPGRFRVPMEPDRRNTHLNAGAIPMPPEIGVVMPFRAVEISKVPFPVSRDSVRRVVVRYGYDLAESSFKCSDERLNRIYDFCKRSVVNCSFCGVFVDGDRERIPYEGDALAQQMGSFAISSDPDIALTTFEHLMDHPTWPTEGKNCMVIMAWNIWERTGQSKFLVKWYDRLVKEKLHGDEAREDGLLVTGSRRDLTDWPICERDGFVFRPVNAAVNAYYCRALRIMSMIARMLGKPSDAATFEADANKASRSYNAVFFNKTTGLYVDGEGTDHSSLHVNALALAFGLAPEGSKRGIADFLAKKGPMCSPYFTLYLFKALLNGGRDDAVFDMILSPGERGWLNMMEFGATLPLESWSLEIKPNLDANHAWACTPLPFIAHYVLGVNPETPGSGKSVVTPHLGPLQWAEGDVPTKGGIVHVRAEKSPDGTVKTTIGSKAQ